METVLQAKNLIENCQNIIILPSQEAQGDSLGSAIALFFTLKKMGKNVNLLTESIPEKFQFLTNIQEMPKEFVISVNTSENEILKLRYEKEDSGLKIFLTPKNGKFNPLHVSFPSLEQKENYQINNIEIPDDEIDLAIIIGTASLESLEGQFKKYADVLSEASVLNIDNQIHNEKFGEVNLISENSLSEITTSLIDSLEKENISQKAATALLTGIIWSSQNFRNPGTQPKTFKIAASLIERGADHQTVIHKLYKQKNISQVKLLGKILEKLTLNDEKELCLVLLNESDFTECQASSKDLSFAVEELKLNFKYLPNLLVLWESYASPITIKGIFHSPNQELIKKILENFEGISRGNSALFLIKGNNLQSAQEKILNII